MKYIVIEIQTDAAGDVGTIVNTYETRYEADSAYHSALASAAVSIVPYHAATLMTNEGNVLRNELYIHTEA